MRWALALIAFAFLPLLDTGFWLATGVSLATYTVLATSWQPEVGAGKVDAADVEAGFARTAELLGFELPVLWCRHPAGPPACWCRKPLPGLGIALIRTHQLDVAGSTFVGRNSTDRLFAERIGFSYLDASQLS